MKSNKHQIEKRCKQIKRWVMCLAVVILAGGMLRGMAPVRVLAAQQDDNIYIEETAETLPETTPSEDITEKNISDDNHVSGSLTAELGGISKNFSLTVTPLAETRAAAVSIGTADQLIDFATKVNSGTYTNTDATLTADIDMSGKTFPGIISYAGTFDGNGHSIKNLSITSVQSDGRLAGFMVKGTPKVEDLTFISPSFNVTCSSDGALHVGVFCHMNGEGGTKFERIQIQNGTFSGTNTGSGQAHIGTITSYGVGAVYTDCIITGAAVTANANAGVIAGIFGSDARETYTNCYFSGTLATVSSGNKVTFAASTNGSNNYYDSNKCTLGEVTNVTAVSGADSVLPKLAIQLNNGRTGSGAPWRYPTGGGYPYLDFTGVTYKNWLDYAMASTDSLSGNGSESTPYTISTPAQMAKFMMKVNGGETGACGKLTADIKSMTDYPWISIGTGNAKYTGTFDGGGYSIWEVNQNIDSQQVLGLFGYTEGTAVIQNLILKDSTITSNTSGSIHETVGSIVGYAAGSTKLIKCGAINITITKTGSNTFFSAFGGLVGDLRDSSSVTDSYFRGKVANGNTGSANAGTWVGGIAGRQCSDTARVTNCYTSAALTNSTPGTKYTAYIIGMSAERTCISNCYYDSTISTAGLSNPGNGIGQTAAQMGTPEFTWKLNATDVEADGRYFPNHVWNYQNTSSGNGAGNNGYPDFKERVKDWQAYGATVPAPVETSGVYQIKSADDLSWFMSQVNSGRNSLNGTVTAAIDLTGTARGGTSQTPVPWVSIGKSVAYTGTFKGDKKTISHLSGDSVFGTVNGTIDGVVLDNTCAVSGQGGIVNMLTDGTVSNCLNNGTVTSTVWAGGIVGKMNDGLVEFSGASGTISSRGTNNSLGGIVGYIAGTATTASVRNCYYRDGNISLSGTCSGHGIAYVESGVASKVTIESCYFSGSMTTDAGTRRYGIAQNQTGMTVRNCVYLENTDNPYTGTSYGTALPSEKLKSWYCAFLLNGKRAGAGTSWTVGQPKGEYPEWGILGAVTDWESVGEMADKPTTSTVGGTNYYIIDSPEDLAWLAYQINHTAPVSGEDYNGLIVADIDLFGGEYTGKSKAGNPATDAAAALPWKPIGYTAGEITDSDAGTVPACYYKGTMIGAENSASIQPSQRTIDYLRVDGTGSYNGLFGYTSGANLSHLTIGANSRVQRAGKQLAGGVAAVVKGGTVRDCVNLGSVKVMTGDSDWGTGGIAGTLNGGTISGCVNQGPVFALNTRWGYNGGIVGDVVQSAVVRECTNKVEVRYGYYSGGIAGKSTGSKIESCTNEGKVTYGEATGGIIGNLFSGEIKDCKNVGLVKAGSPNYVASSGGIAGRAGQSAKVSACENTGAVSLMHMFEGNSVGGIVGQSNIGSIVEMNKNTGAISSADSVSANSVYVGGVVGGARGASVRNNYSMGSISGSSSSVYCGGVAGTIENNANVTCNYFAGSRTGSGTSEGVYGRMVSGTVRNNFFDSDQMSGIADNVQKGGRTTAQMKQWGFAYQLNNAPDLSTVTETVWREASGGAENSGYPVFATSGKMDAAADWSEPGAWVDGFGTIPAGDGVGTPYQIETPEQLAWLAYKVNTDSTSYSQSNANMGKKQLDLFGGRFTGQRDTGDVAQALSWVPIERYSGTLSDGGLENLRIPGGYEYVSFIKVLDGGTVSGLQVRGSITTIEDKTSRMAGIVARAQNGSSIRYCMNWIKIDAKRQAGNNYTGGIVGQVDASTVEYCANFADVLDTNWTYSIHNGGIAGSAENGASVKSCYNAAAASAADKYRAGSGHIVSPRSLNATVTACYYDSDKAGTYSNAVGNVTGLSTTQMKTFRTTQLLNTTNTGSSRVWYTASDDASTGGYPSFTATQQSSITLNPTEALTPVWSKASLSGKKFLYLEQVGGTDLGIMDSGSAVTLETIAGITDNYRIYGTDNANQNLGFGLDSNDLSNAARNAALSAGQVSLYNAAAYNCPSARYFVLGTDLDGVVYEYTLTVSAVTGKTLNMTLPVNAAIKLSPGQEDTAASNSLTVKNNNPYPVDFNISQVKPWEKGNNNATHKLVPVAQSVAVTGDAAYQEMVHLWLTDVSDGSGSSADQTAYYYDPAKGTIPFGGKLGAGGAFSYLYRMDYGAVLSDNNGVFGYDVIYDCSISKADAVAESVQVKHK